MGAANHASLLPTPTLTLPVLLQLPSLRTLLYALELEGPEVDDLRDYQAVPPHVPTLTNEIASFDVRAVPQACCPIKGVLLCSC